MALPSRLLLVACIAIFLGYAAWTVPAVGDEKEEQAAGRELFGREWIPSDSRSLAGDGLGPVFNDTSCVACHNQGGAGGGGSAAKNAQIITVFSNRSGDGGPSMGILGAIFGPSRKPAEKAEAKDRQVLLEEQRDKLKRIHPGLVTARSLVLPRFSTDDGYETVRGRMVGGQEFMREVGLDRDPVPEERLTKQEAHNLDLLKAEGQFGSALFRDLSGGATFGDFTVVLSERNTPALFGSGLIESIPDEVIVAAASKEYDHLPKISGRVARLKDGRIGRFGWKAQTARLNDFVLTACAVELGLEVPERPQLGLPHKPDYKAPGLDLSLEQCNQLTAFVAALPAPQQRVPATPGERVYLLGGQKLFEKVGCAHCHTQQLGDVSGIYSDLLLHDMGRELSDSGSYNGTAPNSTEDEELNQPVPSFAHNQGDAKPADESRLIGATRQEWRTPPLWGLRDSAPYLHDGRAATVEQAIALHGGEAGRSAQKFVKLSAAERLQVSLFLRSLAAPQ